MHRSVVILGLALLCGGGSLATAAPDPPPGRHVRPVADAYVDSSVRKKNFGRAHSLWVSGSPRRSAYVRFDLRGIKNEVVKSARLDFIPRGSGRFSVQLAGNKWNERRITFRNAPRPGKRIASLRARRGATFGVAANVTRFVKAGKQVTFVITAGGKPIRFDSREGAAPPILNLQLEPRTATLIAAGDVGYCGQPYDEATGAVVNGIPGTVAALGDLAYETGTAAEFSACYQPSWGAFKDRTKPAIGNHEYESDPAASGYFGYWGSGAGNPAQGWYSYDLGAWHIIALNSNCTFVGGCGPDSPQEKWLKADLAAHPAPCTLAYWHHPRWSGGQVTSDASTDMFWQDLFAAKADVVLNGHAHNYQRFAPQNPVGGADPARGIREFVVGTGGNPTLHPVAATANTQIMDNTTWGVLKLTLHPRGYDWQFVRAAGGSFTDSGSQSCH